MLLLEVGAYCCVLKKLVAELSQSAVFGSCTHESRMF